MLKKNTQQIHTAVDDNDVVFCYLWLNYYHPVLKRDIAYRVDFDLIDRPMVELMSWYIHDHGYVMSPISLPGLKKRTVYMHRQCAQEKLSEDYNVVDHIDWIKTNNRRSNLRATDYKGNSENTPPKCPFGRDYIQAIHVGRYEAYIPVEDGFSELLGVFETREACIEAQNEYLKNKEMIKKC